MIKRILIALLLIAGCVQAQSLRHVMRRAGVIANARVDPLRVGLVAEYLFTSDARDTSGNGLDGSILGGASITNGTLYISGGDDGIQIAHNELINFNVDDPFTLSIWAKQTVFDTAILIYKTISTSYRGYWFYDAPQYASGYTYCDLRGESTSVLNNYRYANNSYNVWKHYLFMYDGHNTATSGIIYVDNNSDNSENYAFVQPFYITNNVPMYIGTALRGQDDLIGYIDNVRIYNRTLNTDEAEALYNEGHD